MLNLKSASLSIIYSCIFYSLCLFFVGCQNDSISGVDLSDKPIYKKTFFLNHDSSRTVSGIDKIGLSPYLYAGKLENGDTASSFITIKSDLLYENDFCFSDSIANFSFILNTKTKLTSNDTSEIYIDKNAIELSYLFNSNLVDESINFSNEETSLLLNNDFINISYDNIMLGPNQIIVDIKNVEHDLINEVCSNSNIGILVSYKPNQDIETKIIEFYSANYLPTINIHKLDVDFFIESEESILVNRYYINNSAWGDDLSGNLNMEYPYIIDNSNDYLWGMIYLYNDAIENVQNSLMLNPFPVSNQILLDSTDTTINIIQVALVLNQEYKNNIDSIFFYLDEGIAFLYSEDPSNDNAQESNAIYDEGEFWFDWGVDMCPDSLELGNGSCAVSEDLSIYNNGGTEGNGIWDEGESFNDCGLDGNCDDDDNSDNYNIDPNNDNYNSESNLNGEENNGVYDLGEIFNDWGMDGLPSFVTGYLDSTEQNGQWEIGEPWFDWGTDMCPDSLELGGDVCAASKDLSIYNNSGTEGNGIWDEGESFNDCGSDDNCDDGDDSDNYNVDPNNDNYNSESNLNGKENNGVYDLDEIFNDWGIDNIPDSLEVFSQNMQIELDLSNAKYNFNLEANSVELQIGEDLLNDQVSLWISKIIKSNDSLFLDISLKTNIALRGIQFRLNHSPLPIIDTTYSFRDELLSINNGEVIFKDIALYPQLDSPSDELIINYGNNFLTYLEFDSLYEFLQNKELNISHNFTSIIMHFDTSKTLIPENGMFLLLGYLNDGSFNSLYGFEVLSGSESIAIPIGNILRGFQSGEYGNFNNLVFKSNGDRYNFSNVVFQNTNGQQNVEKNIKIEIMY